MPLMARAAALAGALVLVAGFPIYRLWTLLWAQLSPARALGTLAVVGGAVLALALVTAALGRRSPAPAPALLRLVQTGFWAVVLLNGALIGLQVFHQGPFQAPRPWLWAALAGPLALAAAFFRYGDAERTMLVGGAVRLGQALLAIPFLALPWVAWDAAHDQPRLVGAPLPPPAAAVRPDAPRRIILVTYDALRFQSTTLADPRLDTTPHLAALAAQGTSFTQARAASDMTAVAMPALGSGVRPGVYFRAAGRQGALARSGLMTSLAGHLRPAGYATGAYMMGVSPRTLGFDLDFDDVLTSTPSFVPNTFNSREYLPLGPLADWVGARVTRRPELADRRLVHNLYAARALFERGLDFLKARPDRAFVWIHLGVPHAPMADIPPPGEVSDLWRPGTRWVTDAMLDEASPAQMADYRRVYHNYTRFGDAELGRFVAGLRAAELYDDALLVVSSDHGEDLVTSAYATHAHGVLTERVTRVPLVLRLPGGTRGAVDARLASAVDVVPSVLDAVYRELPAGLSGTSLLRPSSPERIVHTWALEARWWNAPRMHASAATYQGRYKYLLHWAPGAAAATESLTDHLADPEGATDLAGHEPALLARLREAQRRENLLGP